MRLSIYHRLVFSSHTLFSHLQFAQKNAIFITCKPFSSESSHNSSISPKQQVQHSFVASYLINSCGFSSEKAKVVASKVKVENPNRADSVIALLKNHGFNDAHIAKIVTWDPRLLNCKSPEKTLLPKLEFLYSIGVSKKSLPDIVCGCANFLTRSLNNGIIPAYNLLKSVMPSDREVVAILKRRPWYVMAKGRKNLTPNIEFLRGIGVPQPKIAYLMGLWADALFLNHVEFRGRVEEVVKMGYDVSKATFVWGLCAHLGERSKAIMDRSTSAYKRCGWSVDDISLVFRKYPQCIFLSEAKIMKAMDFLVNKIGVEARSVAQCPLVLCLSFEKRIRPRGSVAWCLKQKGLLKKNPSLSRIMYPTEKNFLQMFVTKYIEVAPELLRVYQGKVDPFKI